MLESIKCPKLKITKERTPKERTGVISFNNMPINSLAIPLKNNIPDCFHYSEHINGR